MRAREESLHAQRVSTSDLSFRAICKARFAVLALLVSFAVPFAGSTSAMAQSDAEPGDARSEVKKSLRKAPIGPVDQSAKDGQPASGAQTEKRYILKPPTLDFSPPVSTFAEPDFDWGAVLQGEIVEHDFQIKNNGGAVLKIEHVKPACGCTTVDFSREIAPGETGKVTLRVDTKKFSGSVKKTAEVATNSSRGMTRLSMSGRIDPVVEIEPKLPRLEVVRGVEIDPLVVRVTKAAEHTFRILDVKPDSEILTAKLEEDEAGQSYRVLLTPNLEDDSKKYHYAQVDLAVDVGGKTFDLPVRVSITVKDRIEASPASVYFSSRDTDSLRSPGAPAATKPVTIRCLDPKHTFEIKDIEVQGSSFLVERHEVEAGKEYRLDVQLPQLPGSEVRRIAEKIIVRTNDPQIPEIVINATASVRSATTPVPRAVTPRASTNTIVPKGSAQPSGEIVPLPRKE